MSAESENLRFKEYIESHMLQSKESAFEISLAIQKSELNAGHGNYTRTLHIPKFFSQVDKWRFDKICTYTYDIFERVIQAYMDDPEFRKLFPFPKELEELILLEPGYAVPIPICRIDIFYDENDGHFHFCEFNTDGTSAMNENWKMNSLLPLNNAWDALKPDCEIMELMESWIDAFMEDYRQTPDAKENPGIAMTDFLENAYISEFYQFEKRFKNRGLNMEVVDIRELDYDGKKLTSKKSGQQIDVIYRRAVTSDIMDHYDEIQPFIQAVKDKNVVLIGAFKTQIVHHKAINQILIDPYMEKILEGWQIRFLNEHLPKTYDLTSSNVKDFEDCKDCWIIKPKDSYAAKGVWAGADLKHDMWLKVLHDHVDRDFLIQQYIKPFKSLNIDLINSDEFKWYTNQTGLYTYNGKFAGVYSRLSDSGIISTQYNEKMIPTVFLLDE